VGEYRTSKRLPGEVPVGQEPGESSLDEREARRRPTQSSQLFGELPAAGGRVDVDRERGDRAAVELQLAGRVTTRGEQQHRASHGAVELLLGKLELGTGDERDRDEALVLAPGREHLFDLTDDGLHRGNDTIRNVKDVLADVERWRSRGERVALATVVASRRSAPRPIGSKLAVSGSGEMAGSISGGCVEGDVAERAKDVLEGGKPVLLTYGIADEQAFEVGLPCGGEIDVWLERLES
jgi:hypothetical protein